MLHFIEVNGVNEVIAMLEVTAKSWRSSLRQKTVGVLHQQRFVEQSDNSEAVRPITSSAAITPNAVITSES